MAERPNPTTVRAVGEHIYFNNRITMIAFFPLILADSRREGKLGRSALNNPRKTQS